MTTYYHELLPKESMQELIPATRSRGLAYRLSAEQIAKAPERKRAVLQTVFLDENRAAFKAILPAPLTGRRVLDLGCGSGITSNRAGTLGARGRFLRPHVRARPSFLASLRAKDMGLFNYPRNLRWRYEAAAISRRKLRLRHSSTVFSSGRPRGGGAVPCPKASFSFLAKVSLRILQPDGHLYIGIENRYGYGYFFGVPEDHTGVKYASLVPRWLANVLRSSAQMGHQYRTYTYGYGGMHKLLHEVCWILLKCKLLCASIPDYRNFHELYALDARSRPKFFSLLSL